MNRHVDGRAQVERANKMATAVQLRGQGMNYRAIAARLGISVSSAHQLVAAALAQLPAESVQQLRAIESGRLDGLHRALQPGIEGGDPQAIGTAVRVSARRSALLGLDAPAKIEVEPMYVRMHAAMVPEALRVGPVDADGYVEMDMGGGPVRQLASEPETRPEIVGPYD